MAQKFASLGLYLLNQLSSLIPPKLFGHGRDDGLAIYQTSLAQKQKD